PFIGDIARSLKVDDSNSPDPPSLTGLLGITARLSICLFEEQSTSINIRFEPWSTIMRLWSAVTALLHRILK
ncbi:hypothetical protein FRC01_010073, partial [Tulasnella sp. 417]